MFGSAGKRVQRARRMALLVLLALPLAACGDIVGVGDRDIEILSPRSNETLYGYETLRARVRGYDLNDYDIWWYVDGGVERRMHNEWDSHTRHKYYEIDTWDWYWNGRGPYTIGFIAEDRRGRRIGERRVRVYVE